MHKTIAKVTSYVVIVWTVVAFFVLAFRCGASRPWAQASGRCIDEVSPSSSVLVRLLTSLKVLFWIGIAPVDILTELLVIALPTFMMLPVQVALSKKVVIVVAFIFRIL